ncbi:MAG: hypothetical protein P9X22_00645 [Candidatus Zapsychrus exili]|nr:hypothetical protein [Candidatus Zapsychrus exili]
MNSPHNFHIPVMGTGFTIDSPIKVAKYGISSVISLVDDTMIEQMRKHYCGVIGREYIPITKNDEDYRADRITAYLDLVDDIVKMKFQEVQSSSFDNGEIKKYFNLLNENAPLALTYKEMIKEANLDKKKKLQDYLRKSMKPGSIHVNIMTKLDRTNYGKDKQELPKEFSDAMSALRGFAKSKLESAIVFSAGFNRKLYSYAEKFEDFFANAKGFMKKKIIIKVSDYRSSLIQGRFLAKKGLWVSEYRIESGLNCGGHAFASQGFLMGPILEEFRKKKNELTECLHSIYSKAVEAKNKLVFNTPHPMHITAQGGIGTSKEHNFLFNNYDIDSAGWGTPFLLVPEAVNVDKETMDKLVAADEEDLSLSDISPIGVEFNNLNNSLSEINKQKRIDQGTPGSPCFKGHLSFNTEFGDAPVCLASRKYQQSKIAQLKEKDVDEQTYAEEYKKIVEKACICHELGASPLKINNLLKIGQEMHTAICPGPELAYFNRIVSLKEMVDHIYGKLALISDKYRPNMFIKELKLYIEYLSKEVKKINIAPDKKQIEYFTEFKNNLIEGIEYYKELFPKMIDESESYRGKALGELILAKESIDSFIKENTAFFTLVTV